MTNLGHMTSAQTVRRGLEPPADVCRVRKLKETLVTVQQLDKNMSNLRAWLSRVEAQLSQPLVYQVCHADEIQRKLAQQQVRSSSAHALRARARNERTAFRKGQKKEREEDANAQMLTSRVDRFGSGSGPSSEDQSDQLPRCYRCPRRSAGGGIRFKV